MKYNASYINTLLKNANLGKGFDGRAWASIEVGVDTFENFPAWAFLFLKQNGYAEFENQKTLGKNTWKIQSYTDEFGIVSLNWVIADNTVLGNQPPSLVQNDKLVEAVQAIEDWEEEVCNGNTISKHVGHQIEKLLYNSEGYEIGYSKNGTIFIVYTLKNLFGSRRWRWSQNCSKALRLLQKNGNFASFKVDGI